MTAIYFEYWKGMVNVFFLDHIPADGRYLCTDWNDKGEEIDFYDVGADFIVGVYC